MKAKFLLSLLFLLSFYPWSSAQSREYTNYQDTLVSSSREINAGEQTLEKAVNPKEYIVGPGDVLFIVLWDEFQTNYSLKVTPEGTILIPRVGSLIVAGNSLEEVKSSVKDEVLKRYRNIDITISLLNLRKFKVSVTGSVKNPGIYSTYANERVSEIIEKAGKGLPNSSTRNILLKRNDGSEMKVDVLRFLKTGKNDRNPYVLDGDIICVPLKDTSINIFGIYGAVKDPGEYEYFEGDSLKDLIDLAGGLTGDADISIAEIVRFSSDDKHTQSLKKDLKSLFSVNAQETDIPLMPDDRVFIRSIPDFREKKQVTLEGEVLYPGVYAINEGITRLSDLVELAGGFTKKASLDEAEMIRGFYSEEVDLEFERLKKIPVSDMKSYEYEYFKTKSREKPGRVSVDFVKLFKGKDQNEDVMLKDKDRINIPAKSLVVKVSGRVVNPGYLTYEPGKNYLYYINKTGGLSWRADKGKIKLIKGVTGEWTRPNKNIEAGDVIWVPEKPERHYWSSIRDILTAAGSVATIYLAVREATK
jgi:protein involved in polysaccharide export with SLBB domain